MLNQIPSTRARISSATWSGCSAIVRLAWIELAETYDTLLSQSFGFKLWRGSHGRLASRRREGGGGRRSSGAAQPAAPELVIRREARQVHDPPTRGHRRQQPQSHLARRRWGGQDAYSVHGRAASRGNLLRLRRLLCHGAIRPCRAEPGQPRPDAPRC